MPGHWAKQAHYALHEPPGNIPSTPTKAMLCQPRELLPAWLLFINTLLPSQEAPGYLYTWTIALRSSLCKRAKNAPPIMQRWADNASVRDSWRTFTWKACRMQWSLARKSLSPRHSNTSVLYTTEYTFEPGRQNDTLEHLIVVLVLGRLHLHVKNCPIDMRTHNLYLSTLGPENQSCPLPPSAELLHIMDNGKVSCGCLYAL